MKVRLTKKQDTIHGPQEPGFEIDHPDAHLLVTLGVAEPVEPWSDNDSESDN